MTPNRDDPEYRALLASVLAAPRDDAPRLVLADWVEEHDDAPFAAFIRWSVKHRKTTWVARKMMFLGTALGEEATATSVSVIGPHAPPDVQRWFAGYAEQVLFAHPSEWEWTWHRGFPARLRMPANDALDRLGGLLENWPITGVMLTGQLSRDRHDALHNRFLTQLARHRPKTTTARLFHYFGGRVRFREEPRHFPFTLNPQHPQLGGDVIVDPDRLREQVEMLMNSMQKVLIGRGARWTLLP